MLVLALVLPTLVFADKAPPPKTSIILSPYNGQFILKYSLTSAAKTGQVFCYQITTANQISPNMATQAVTGKDTKHDNKSYNIVAYNYFEPARVGKTLYLSLRQSGKDKVGWQSSLHNLTRNLPG